MSTENIDLRHVSDTTVNLAAITTKNNRWLFDTTKDHAVAYKADGSTLRHFLMADSSNNLINVLGNASVADGAYFGLGAAKGRFQFDDEVLDTITIKSAALIGEDYFQIGQDVDNADFAALILKNTNDPLTTEVGQSVSINAYLRKSIDGGSNYSDELAAQIIFGKDSDFFHASDESDCDGNIQFLTTLNGTIGERVRITSGGDMGIGTTTPAGRLELAKAAGNTLAYASCYSDTLAEYSVLTFRKSHSDTLGTIERTLDGEYLGAITFQGANNAGPDAFATGAKILCIAVGDAGADYVGAKLMFQTGKNDATFATRMTITDQGAVCIDDRALYLGPTVTTANIFRFYDDGTDLLVQKYEGGSWVTKMTVVS